MPKEMPWIQLRETGQTKCFVIDLDNMGEVNSYIDNCTFETCVSIFFHYGFVWTYDATWYRQVWWLNWSEYPGAMPWKVMVNPIALCTHSFFSQCVYPEVGLFLSVISSHFLVDQKTQFLLVKFYILSGKLTYLCKITMFIHV